MFAENADPCCTDEQKQALKMMDDWKRHIQLSLSEDGVSVELTPEEEAILDRIKEMIRDFWYT